MTSPHDFAVLAPVPSRHLESGLEMTGEEIAYGTNKWEFLDRLDEMASGEPVAMLIYPSHEGDKVDPNCIVTWFGWYVGQSRSNAAGRHPNAKAFRPPSSESDGPWATFWHVAGLRRLPKERQIPIGKIQGYKGGWRKEAPPRGPELVLLPDTLADEG